MIIKEKLTYDEGWHDYMIDDHLMLCSGEANKIFGLNGDDHPVIVVTITDVNEAKRPHHRGTIVKAERTRDGEHVFHRPLMDLKCENWQRSYLYMAAQKTIAAAFGEDWDVVYVSAVSIEEEDYE